MAIARGAGTEIIRTHQFEDVPGTSDAELIIGVQHHIYTILSITMYVNALNTAGTDYILGFIKCFDAYAGATGQNIKIFKWTPSAVGETYVWNDKCSFNGAEPTGVSTIMNTVAEQDAIADQGTTTAQGFAVNVSHASANFDIGITFIDQNNA